MRFGCGADVILVGTDQLLRANYSLCISEYVYVFVFWRKKRKHFLIGDHCAVERMMPVDAR